MAVEGASILPDKPALKRFAGDTRSSGSLCLAPRRRLVEMQQYVGHMPEMSRKAPELAKGKSRKDFDQDEALALALTIFFR